MRVERDFHLTPLGTLLVFLLRQLQAISNLSNAALWDRPDDEEIGAIYREARKGIDAAPEGLHWLP